MYRFLLYSLIIHSLIVALLFVSILFTPKPKPKNIQIKLAVLPKNNNIKKTAPPTETPIVEEQKETPEQAKEKAEQVQKLLDNVLKEDIKEKIIEKSIPQKELDPKPIKLESIIKETPKQVFKEIPKQSEVIKNNYHPKSQKQEQEQLKEQKQENIPVYKLPEKQEIPVSIPMQASKQYLDSKPNPYSNPVIPLEIPKIENDTNNPYLNQVMPIEEEVVPIPETIPSLPAETMKPKRREIDVSKVKDENVAEEANRITNHSSGISNDIMSSKAFYLSSNDKKALMNQMSQCLASLGMIRENNETLTLLIEMKSNAKIKDINVVKDNKIIPKEELSNLESRIIYLFNNPKCSKLILPEGKFSYWQKFTIKLNLKGLFG